MLNDATEDGMVTTKLADKSEKKGDNESLFRRLRKWYREDIEHDRKWRTEAREDYGFLTSDGQWLEDDRKVLEDLKRPVITFNRVDPIIRSVSGEQINNRQEVRYLPREEGDAKPNEVYTSAARWFRDQSDADDEESEAFWDAAVAGRGVTETRLDIEADPDEPMPIIERIDPFEIIPDARARKRCYTDARRVWRVREVSLDEAEDEYPDEARHDLDATWARLDNLISTSDSAEAQEYETGDSDRLAEDYKDKEVVTQVQCQWWEKRTFYKVIDPFSGQITELSEKKFKELEKRVLELAPAVLSGALPDVNLQLFVESLDDDARLRSVRLKKRVYRQAFLGRKILKVQDSPCPDHFTFNFVTGFRDRNGGHFYGLVRGMKDPQRMANKFFSQTLHLMNSTAKGGVMMEEGAVEDIEKFERSWARTEAVTWVPEGALSNPNGPKIVPKPVAPFPVGFFNMMEFCISSIRDSQGINLELLGMREVNQPASLEMQRRQAGITILAPLFSAMRKYHRNQGKVMLYFIQHHLASDPQMADQRLVRIVGQEGAKYAPLTKQLDVKYDVVVDEGPTTPNQKERVWALVGEAFWTLPPPIQLVLIKYSPFPESVIEEVKAAAQKAEQDPAQQMQMQMAQLEMRLKKLEGDLTEAETAKTVAEARQIMAEMGQGPEGEAPPQLDPTKVIELQAESVQRDKDRQHELDKQTADQDFELAKTTAQLETEERMQTRDIRATATENQRDRAVTVLQSAQGSADKAQDRNAAAAEAQRNRAAASEKQTMDAGKSVISEFAKATFAPKPKKEPKK